MAWRLRETTTNAACRLKIRFRGHLLQIANSFEPVDISTYEMVAVCNISWKLKARNQSTNLGIRSSKLFGRATFPSDRALIGFSNGTGAGSSAG